MKLSPPDLICNQCHRNSSCNYRNKNALPCFYTAWCT